MAMILTILRITNNDNITSPMVCDDTDFNTALELVKILIQHAARIYEALPAQAAQSKATVFRHIAARIFAA
jgi:hypothetical protein